MRTETKYWTPEEVTKLPQAWEQYGGGQLDKQQMETLFGRSFDAIKYKYRMLTGLTKKVSVTNKVMKKPRKKYTFKATVPAVESRPLKTIRMIENDRIVTYQELVTA